ncbi:MAG: sodium:calcium antiporter, partial [Gemmobacter sp.]|nr:sodium:calcium antiporter [Gemmobacter sp.]
MLLDIVYLVAGLIILVLGGDALVKGAVSLSLRLGIPALVVGLTVVAFGTSAPELLVSIQAVLSGRPGIALGNVIGSNIVNVLLILGLPLLFTVIHSSKIDARRGYVVMLLSSVLFIAVCFAGPITWVHALILLTGMSLMLLDNLRIARAHRAAASHDLEIADPHMRPWKIALLIVGGLIGLALGANLLVEGAVNIARVMGVSETAIGLTLVALGTSLPELVTS